MNKKLLATAMMMVVGQWAWADGAGDSVTVGEIFNEAGGLASSGVPTFEPIGNTNIATSTVVIQLPQTTVRSAGGAPMAGQVVANGNSELGTIGSSATGTGIPPAVVTSAPIAGQVGANGNLEPGTIGTSPTGSSGQPAVVTAVSASASQTYQMYQPPSGPAVPNLQTLTSQTNASAQVFTSTQASQGTGTTINSAADAANHIATTNNVAFHSDAATGIYWGSVGSSPDANGLYVDAGKHYIFGPPVTNMPTSGTATYAFMGNTIPSITLAGSASYGSGSNNSFSSGNFTANFTASTLTTPTMAMNFPAKGLTLTIPAGTTIAYGGANTAQSVNVLCTGGCTSSVTGSINTRFTGSGASGLGVAITAYGGAVPVTINGQTTNYPLSAAVVAAYKKQ